MSAYAATMGAFRICSTQCYVVADEEPQISRRICEMAASGCNLILTTGGTGCSKRVHTLF